MKTLKIQLTISAFFIGSMILYGCLIDNTMRLNDTVVITSKIYQDSCTITKKESVIHINCENKPVVEYRINTKKITESYFLLIEGVHKNYKERLEVSPQTFNSVCQGDTVKLKTLHFFY